MVASLLIGSVAWAGSEHSVDPGGSGTQVDAAPARDPWLRPFSSTSIWNMPVGSGAKYKPANFPYTKSHALETTYLMKTSTSDPARSLMSVGSWRDRCSGTKSLGTKIHLPDGWMPKPVTATATPNNPGVFLQPDGRTLVNVGTMARCSATGPLHANRPGDDKHITDLYGDGISGAHGASRLSQIGGAIRPGELNGSAPITHALDLLVWSEHLYYGGTKESSYRWPASSSDRYAGPDRYRGSNPELRMGSLVAIPPNVTAASLGIDTAVGRKLFAALQDYGAYITDDSAWNATYIGVDSNAIGTFSWGDAERDDMAQMVQSLSVITNNSPRSVGGGGTPRQPLLPELGEGSATPASETRVVGPPPGPSAALSGLVSAQRIAPPVEVAAPTTGTTIFADTFDSAQSIPLSQRTNPRWKLYNGVIEADDGAAVVTTARGSTFAVAEAGTSDVVIRSSITLSPNRAAPGLALRTENAGNGIVMSAVVRNGQNRVSLHAVVNGSYRLLDEVDDAGLTAGATYDFSVRAVGADITVTVDGRVLLTHRLSTADEARFDDNTSHGLRIMANATADDGRSRWNDIDVSRA